MVDIIDIRTGQRTSTENSGLRVYFTTECTKCSFKRSGDISSYRGDLDGRNTAGTVLAVVDESLQSFLEHSCSENPV